MEPIAILLYGYSRGDAAAIKEALDSELGTDLFLLSASGGEDVAMSELLDRGGTGEFEERSPRFLMFLGFEDGQISTAMRKFPPGDIERPIFCALTEENINWTVAVLAEHLAEERKRIRGA